MSEAGDVRVSGTVAYVLSAPPNGGAIFRLRCSKGPRLLRVVASYKILATAPQVGTYWTVSGFYDDERQLHATSAMQSLPTHEGLLDFMCSHPSFAFLGKRRAKRLWRKLGFRLSESLSHRYIGDFWNLGLSAHDTILLFDRWSAYCTETRLVKSLVELGLSVSASTKLLESYGGRVNELIDENPYRLIAAFQWALVDHVAETKFSVENKGDARRLDAACEQAFRQEQMQGFTAIGEARFKGRLEKLLGTRLLADLAVVRYTDNCAMYVFREGTQVLYQSKSMFSIENYIFSRLKHPIGFSAQDREKGCKGLLCVSVQHIPEASRLLTQSTAASVSDTVELWPTDKEAVDATTNQRTSISLERVFRNESLTFEQCQGHTVVVRRAHCYDNFVLYSILRRLSPSSNVVLTGDGNQTQIDGVGRPFLGLLLSASAATGTEQFAIASCSEMADVEEFDTHTVRELFRTAMAEYFAACVENETAIVTCTWAAAIKLNSDLHQEGLSFRKANGLDVPAVQLSDRTSATIGDRIVYRSHDFDAGLLKGTRGTVLDIAEDAIGTKVKGAKRLVVRFDGGGISTLNVEQMRNVALGYAAPLKASLLHRWANVIACCDGLDANEETWKYTARARAIGRCVYVGDLTRQAKALGQSGSVRRYFGYGLTIVNRH
ncbi:ATP-dependent RecD-like DNA helicase [Caballeronia peredens]|nr:ATP-dependent RecD-like DNA helicase [Caballeronia peredens]